MNIRDEKLTVQRDEGIVVFLIGLRINKWWLLPVLWGAASAFNRMMKELQGDPESGLLSYESFGGRTTLAVQYWRSFEDLHRFAHDRQRAHIPAWRRWAKEWVMTKAIGIWHETYVVDPGRFECVYHHMPPFGLGRVGTLVPATGPRSRAADRLTGGRELIAPPHAAASVPG
ncbi:MAG: DUF4188 domain-containing protein [Myxococcales bacterium]|nr:DUF4188 domain-containing protein [Myxococcales bacterium]MCB9717242.1 DUF4188 domain-containing protein [Myxococcales bacterium]